MSQYGGNQEFTCLNGGNKEFTCLNGGNQEFTCLYMVVIKNSHVSIWWIETCEFLITPILRHVNSWLPPYWDMWILDYHHWDMWILDYHHWDMWIVDYHHIETCEFLITTIETQTYYIDDKNIPPSPQKLPWIF
jgi:hypothetical protein